MIKNWLINTSINICFLIAFFMLTFNTDAIASDVTASSCSASDIQGAIDQVISTGGGTVNIPACQADNTWKHGDGILVSTDVTFRIKGAGKDATVIGYQDGASDGGIGFDGTGLVEISDFTFRGSDTGGIPSGIVLYSMNTENLRIHDLRIQKFKTTALYVCHNPDSPMLIDHNEFGDQYDRYMYGIRVHGTNQQSDYAVPASFGVNNPNAVFIEDNVFDNCYHSVSGFATSKIVFRYNTVRNPTSYIDGHGPCFDVGCRRDTEPDSGTYIYEIYNNTIDSGSYPWCINIRGGTGIVTDNTLINCNIGFRLEMESCSAGASCTASQGCPQSNTDTNACYQSPDQWWVWNNDYRGSGDLIGDQDRGTGCIRENYEYYLRSPQGGDPVESYSKYTYPHPLVSDAHPYIPPNIPPTEGNSAPVAVDDNYSTDEEVPLNVIAPGVLDNDADADDDVLTAVLDVGPINGTLVPNTDGSFSYSPDIGFIGRDSFSYRASDGKAFSNVVTVIITVAPSSDFTTLELKGKSDTAETAIANGDYSQMNFGASDEELAVGLDPSRAVARSLIRWDLSSIPPESTILSAQMSLYSHYSYGRSITIDAHRVLKAWVEGTLDWQQRELDDPDSSCWIEYGYGKEWDAPGADGAADRAATIISSETKAGTGWYAWDIKEAVQKWVDGDWVNDGLILKADNESVTNMKFFVPSENRNETLQPKLVIEYTQPSSGNQPPVLDPIGAKEVTEEELLEFVITASDPDDEDILTYTADYLPSGAIFDPESHTFSWTPVLGDAGDYTVTFSVTDSGTPPKSDSEEITIMITGNPILTNYPPTAKFKFVKYRRMVKFTDLSTDSDGTIVSRKWNFGDGHSRTTTRQTIWYYYRRPGTYPVTLTVTDDGGETDFITNEVTSSVSR